MVETDLEQILLVLPRLGQKGRFSLPFMALHVSDGVWRAASSIVTYASHHFIMLKSVHHFFIFI